MLLAYYGFVVGVGPADHLAHLGGLLAGIGMGLVLPRLGAMNPRSERRLAWACGLGAVVLAGTSGALQYFYG